MQDLMTNGPLFSRIMEEYGSKEKQQAGSGAQAEKTDESKESKDSDAAKSATPVTTPPATSPTPPTPKHAKYALNRHVFTMRQDEHRRRRQTNETQNLAPRLPGAPRGAVE